MQQVLIFGDPQADLVSLRRRPCSLSCQSIIFCPSSAAEAQEEKMEVKGEDNLSLSALLPCASDDMVVHFNLMTAEEMEADEGKVFTLRGHPSPGDLSVGCQEKVAHYEHMHTEQNISILEGKGAEEKPKANDATLKPSTRGYKKGGRCHYCSSTLRTFQGAMKHMAKHPSKRSEHICCLCKGKLSDLDQHFRAFHFPDDEYECPKCFAFFTTKASLATHLLQAHGRSLKGDKSVFNCGKCNHIFLSKARKKNHTLQAHSKPGERESKRLKLQEEEILKCVECGKTFASRLQVSRKTLVQDV